MLGQSTYLSFRLRCQQQHVAYQRRTVLLPAVFYCIRPVQVSLFVYTDLVVRYHLHIVAKQVQFLLVRRVCEEFAGWMITHMDETSLEVCFHENIHLKRKRAEIQRKLTQFEEGLDSLSRMKIA